MNDSWSCGILAHGAVRIPWDQIPALRKSPGPNAGESVGTHIRLSDEQTVLGVAALLRAKDDAGWKGTAFQDWGVVASARHFGRLRFTTAIERYRRLNVRGTSPLVIPHISLHAIAGTLSLALGIHGPHFGVSGNPDHLSEVFMAGLGLLHSQQLPGVWVVATEMTPEPIPDAKGEPTNAVVGQAVAFAITPDVSGAPWQCNLGLTSGAQVPKPANLSDLIDCLQSPLAQEWRCEASGGGLLEFRKRAVMPLRRAG